MYLEFFHSRYIACASIMKPLYVWTAHQLKPVEIDEEQIICCSSNADTDMLFEQTSKSLVLSSLNSRLGEKVFDPALSWGQQPVNGFVLNELYGQLVKDVSPEAEYVKALMKMVRPVQRFGVPFGYSMKAGWDMTPEGKLTLLVVVLPGELGKDVTSFMVRGDQLSEEAQGTWKSVERLTPEYLPVIHEDHFSQELQVLHDLLLEGKDTK